MWRLACACVCVSHAARLSRGCGFVTYRDARDAEALLHDGTRVCLDGHRPVIKAARPAPEMRQATSGRHRVVGQHIHANDASSSSSSYEASRHYDTRSVPSSVPYSRPGAAANGDASGGGGGGGGNNGGSPGHGIPGRIFVHSLPASVKSSDLFEYFGQWGMVSDAHIPKDYQTGNPRPFGFVSFVRHDDADRCLQQDVHTILGKKVGCKRADGRGRQAAPGVPHPAEGNGYIAARQAGSPSLHHDVRYHGMPTQSTYDANIDSSNTTSSPYHRDDVRGAFMPYASGVAPLHSEATSVQYPHPHDGQGSFSSQRAGPGSSTRSIATDAKVDRHDDDPYSCSVLAAPPRFSATSAAVAQPNDFYYYDQEQHRRSVAQPASKTFLSAGHGAHASYTSSTTYGGAYSAAGSASAMTTRTSTIVPVDPNDYYQDLPRSGSNTLPLVASDSTSSRHLAPASYNAPHHPYSV